MSVLGGVTISRMKALAFVTCVLLLISPAAQAASSGPSAGRVEGVVADQNDARVVNASVKVEGRRIRRELRTDEEGRFHVELPAGVYRVTVYSPGFGLFRQKGVRVQAGVTATVRVALKVAAAGPCPDAKRKGKGVVICM